MAVGFNWLLNNKLEGVAVFGLVIESTLEKRIVSFLVHISQIAIGTSNGGGVILKGNKLSLDNEGLVDRRGKDNVKFLLGVFPKLI